MCVERVARVATRWDTLSQKHRLQSGWACPCSRKTCAPPCWGRHTFRPTGRTLVRGRPLRPRRERSRAGVQVRGHQFRLLHTSGGLTYGARTRGSHGPTSCLREHKGQSPPLRPQAPSCEEAQTPVWAAAATESLCGPDAAGGQAVLSPRSGGGATPRVLPGGAAESPGREPECGRAGRRPGRDALVRSRSRRPGPGGGGSDLAQNARPSWGGGAWWGAG